MPSNVRVVWVETGLGQLRMINGLELIVSQLINGLDKLQEGINPNNRGSHWHYHRVTIYKENPQPHHFARSGVQAIAKKSTLPNAIMGQKAFNSPQMVHSPSVRKEI